jgi:membrane protease YdiL (CAAX protease family)
MTLFDDNLFVPPEQEQPSPSPEQPANPEASLVPLASDLPLAQISGELPLGGDPIYLAASHTAETHPAAVFAHQPPLQPALPEDLRISWSWVHLIFFLMFAFVAVAILPLLISIPYLQGKHIPPQEMERYLYSIPQFVIGSTFITFGAILFFLYITLAVLTGQPFWRTLGWRKLSNPDSHLTSKPWIYFLGGCGLSIIAAIVGSRVHTPDDMPIQALQNSKTGLMLMMALAVAVAPLVEETVFRGYLYPVLVRIISGITHSLGMEFSRATHVGVVSSILLTGVLFGLLHGAQLAWTWGIVGLLIFVGITFTYVRARTGTVVASYFMHLGYNSLIAIITAIGTHGFTKIPPLH